MKYQLPLLIASCFLNLFINQHISAQPDPHYLSKINYSENTNALFSNPELIDSILKNKQIILLGEMDHGDGTSFKIKSQFIKYLNEKHGFNTLVFEASKINCDILWDSLNDEANVHELAKENIYYIWSQVKETRELFNWIAEKKKTGNPIKIIGIGPQFSGTNEADKFIGLLKKLLPIELMEHNDFNLFESELRLVSTWIEYPKEKDHKITEGEMLKLMELYEKEILKKLEGDKKQLWKIYFENVKLHTSIKWQRKEDSFERRDQQMFNNLKYYMDENKDEKIMVWAANAHLVRDDKKLGENKILWLSVKKLGDHIYEKYPNKTYSIGFTAGRGKTLDWSSVFKNNKYKIKTPELNSLEHSLSSFNQVFIDLKLYEQNNQLSNYESQLIYTNRKFNAKWSDHFDGVVFIKNMMPSTPTWQSAISRFFKKK